MNYEVYAKKLEGYEYKEAALFLFKYFERYINKENSLKNLNYEEERQSLISNQIYETVKYIKKLYKKDKYNLQDSYFKSLETNIYQFIYKKSKTIEHNEISDSLKPFDDKVKFRKILYSYINLSRFLIIKNEITRGIETKPILLCVGTEPEYNDEIFANREVEMITEICNTSESMVAISLYKCRYNVFYNKIKKFPIQYLHVAGHGSNESIKFADSNRTYNGFQRDILENNQFPGLIFLNICNSYEGYSRIRPICNNALVHRGPVNSNEAIRTAQEFYDIFSQHGDLYEAWDTIKHDAINIGYEMVRQ